VNPVFGALLAQAGANPDAAGVPGLPSPPWLETVLFENPWTLMVGVLAAGALSCWWLNRAERGRAAAAVLVGAVAVTIGLFFTARLVTTERELLMDRTGALVDAAARADLVAIERMLAPDVRVVVFGRERGFTAQTIPRWIDDHMRPGTGMYALRAHSVGRLSATIDGPNTARTQCRVRVTTERVPLTTGSWWRISWRKDPVPAGGTGADAWHVTQIEALQIDAVPQGSDVNTVGP
jgi:hypothetical protein